MRAADQEVITKLQNQILQMQGQKVQEDEQGKLHLGEMESAFPGKIFPRAAIHEFISLSPQAASGANAFIAIILGKLMKQNGCCVWISTRRRIFPPALKIFGIEPERILFVDAWKVKEALWTIEEALKCQALSAVVGEIGELSFNDSRRLQLVVEKSRVTGFIHRQQPKNIGAVACVSRWQVKPMASELPEGIPGPGFPRWQVELLKVRNGKPGKWLLQWSPKGLEYIQEKVSVPEIYERKTA